MTYIIAEPCIDTKDASCVEVCPVDCIYEGDDIYYIHPVECIDCGACEPECPVTAIFPDTEVPPEWISYIAKNRRPLRRRLRAREGLNNPHLGRNAIGCGSKIRFEDLSER